MELWHKKGRDTILNMICMKNVLLIVHHTIINNNISFNNIEALGACTSSAELLPDSFETRINSQKCTIQFNGDI